jgi:hypothetical protein
MGLLVCEGRVQARDPHVHVSSVQLLGRKESRCTLISAPKSHTVGMYDVVEVGRPPAPPPGVGVLYAVNHPNALLDGALLM